MSELTILGFRKESHQDWDRGLSSVIFTYGCNYRCPACHDKKLVEGPFNQEALFKEEELIKYLSRRKDLINKIVICGGEPTIQHTLPSFLKKLKEKGLAVKLDTNGSDYNFLGKLKEEGLVDYVAMDVKGPPQIYADIIGREFIDARDGYEKAIALISHFPDYEFRTTIVPVVRRNGEISFMTPEEIGQTAKLIYDNTGINTHKYFLQPFVPRKGELVDSRLESFPETPKELLDKGLIEAKKYLPNTKIR
jgi:pyruvate formate lyase activating enzyme